MDEFQQQEDVEERETGSAWARFGAVALAVAIIGYRIMTRFGNFDGNAWMPAAILVPALIVIGLITAVRSGRIRWPKGVAGLLLNLFLGLVFFVIAGIFALIFVPV